MSSCEGCMFWSQMIATCQGNGAVEALCMCPSSPKYQHYSWRGCRFRQAGTAIDDPAAPAEAKKEDPAYTSECARCGARLDSPSHRANMDCCEPCEAESRQPPLIPSVCARCDGETAPNDGSFAPDLRPGRSPA